MSVYSDYDDRRSERPSLFFRSNPGMSKSFQMETFNGKDNPAYIDDRYPDYDDDDSIHPITVDAANHSNEGDSGRGSRDGEPHVRGNVSIGGDVSIRGDVSIGSRSRDADEVRDFGGSDHDSVSSVGHFRPGYSTDDSLSDSSVVDDQRPLSPHEEDTLEKRIEKWNVFATAPHIDSDESKEFCYAMVRKVMKVMTYIVMLPVMTGLLVLSKGSVLIAVSNIRPFVGSNNNINSNTTSPPYIPDSWNTTEMPYTTEALYTGNATDMPYTTYSPDPVTTSYDLMCKSYNDTRLYYTKDENDTSIPNWEPISYTRCVLIPYQYTDFAELNYSSCINPANDTGNLVVVKEGFLADQCVVVRNYWVWSILLMICTPYVFTFLRCFWRVLFKKKKSPTKSAIAATLLIETLHTIGLCMLFFVVLPALDNAILALMFLLGVATVPGTLKIFIRQEGERFRIIKVVLDIIAALFQLIILIIWPVNVMVREYDSNLIWSIPTSLLLVSVRWWENFLEKYSRLGSIRKRLSHLSGEMRRSRTKIQILASLWKIVVSFLTMMFCMATQVNYMDPLEPFGRKFTAIFNFSLSQCTKFDEETNETIYTISENDVSEMELDWVWVWLTNCCASLICYFFARSAAKMRIQQVCYSLPVMISTPLLFGMMVGGCELWNNDPCTFSTSEISGYLFYKCYGIKGPGAVWIEQLWILLPFWWLSQLWIAWHIWFPKNARLATADTLFVLPLYDGVLMEQSLLYNRERNDEPRSQVKVLAPSGTAENNLIERARLERIEETRRDEFLDRAIRRRDEIPMVYICATMWHENETEMIQMLKSIFKLDIDQASRKNAQQFFRIQDPDYYEFEAHIFFDNAFDNHDLDQYEYRANDFVRLLVSVVDKAAAEVHEFNISLGPPTKFPTPYGGRLVWTMPGGNKIITHLKDSAKIRHKKRWSQVMYMYYFLGFGLWMDSGLSTRSKQVRAENTFLLALDGDVDFEPIALVLLIDLMKRNGNLGAACGRIHPNGKGPMVWYQYFEYALGHWMQKATEHVIGCVLCSPGCFSLFRGLALMEDNVMARYTTKPTEPKHHIQYDQGEDRWLCTLILQQGYRVEYCAASDSITFSPEGFNEFFNQRRRWMPSTMANVFDLLTSWKHTTTANDNISLLYIIYQAFLLGASIVGPGTIFMMMVGSMDVAFQGRLGVPLSALLNFIPLLIFVILCYVASADIQLIYAQILTGLYCLVQMLVLIGILVEMAKNDVCYPTTVFFLFVSGTFVLGAVLHPQEFFCLVHGFTYYLAIPTMYMLLMIYSMCNLHVVSWGTREVKQTPTEKQLLEQKEAEAEAKRQEEEKKKKKGITASVMAMAKGKDDQEGWTWRCGDCCSYTCCPHEARSNERIVELKLILAEMEKMGKKFETEIEELKKTIVEEKKKLEEDNNDGNSNDRNSEDSQSVISRQIINARRLTDAALSEHGSQATGDDHDREEEDRRLHDIDEVSEITEAEEEDEEAPEELEHDHDTTDDEHNSSLDLLEADRRGSHASGCSSNADKTAKEPKPVVHDELINPFWSTDEDLGYGPTVPIPESETVFFQDLITVYLHPLIKDKVKEERDAAGLKELRNEISVAFLLLNTIFVVVVFVMQLNMDVIYIPWPCGDDVRVEPIGFMFMMTFGVIMVVQIIGMLVHRTGTFIHIMATTILPCGREGEDSKVESLINLAKKMGKLDELYRITINTLPGTWKNDTFTSAFGDDIAQIQKKTAFLIDRNAKKRGAIKMSVGQVFAERFNRLEKQMDNDDPDLNKIQRKLLGGASAGYFSKMKTESALKTYREMRQTVTGRGGTVTSAVHHDQVVVDDVSVDYTSSEFSSAGGTFRPRVVSFDRHENDRYATGRRASARVSIEVPEEDY